MAAKNSTLTQERLKELLHYDPETGLFGWIIPRIGVSVGPANATVSPSGHCRIGVDGKRYLAHRIAWLYMTGEFPKQFIDHKNRIGHDNRWNNLRDVSNSVNLQNMAKAPKTNLSTGILGVAKSRGKRFVAKIQLDKKQIYIGTYDTVEQAHNAYVDMKRKIHSGCTI